MCVCIHGLKFRKCERGTGKASSRPCPPAARLPCPGTASGNGFLNVSLEVFYICCRTYIYSFLFPTKGSTIYTRVPTFSVCRSSFPIRTEVLLPSVSWPRTISVRGHARVHGTVPPLTASRLCPAFCYYRQ